MSWTPGHRRVPPGLKRTVGQHMIALAMIEKFTVRVFGNKPDDRAGEVDVEDDSPIEEGDDVVLSFDRGARKFAMYLSTLTTVELDMMYQAMTIAYEEARLVTLARDKTAEEAMNNGDAIYYRSLRGDPKLSVFRRTQREHTEELPGGHPDAVAGGEPAGGDQPG